MKVSTEDIVAVLRLIAKDLQSPDGVANVFIDAAANRMTLLANLVAKHVEEMETANQRIKRLEEENNELRAEEARLLNTSGELETRIKRLEEAVYAYRTAYTPDGHVSPHDCFATGPKTGDPFQDLFACPGCWAELKAKEAKP